MADLKVNVILELEKAKNQLRNLASEFSKGFTDPFKSVSLKAGEFAKGVGSGLTGGTVPTGGAGAIGGAMGGAGAIGLAILGMASGIKILVGILTQASGFLRGILRQISRTLMLILKPIGDILGVALMPLLELIRPIAVFFNILMRPYIRQAMKAMRLGSKFLRAGETEKATGAFAIGAGFMLKPFADMLVVGMTKIIQGSMQGFKALGLVILSLIPGTKKLREGFSETMDDLIGTVGDMGKGVIETSNKWMNDMLTGLESDWQEIVDVSGGNMDVYKKIQEKGIGSIIGTTKTGMENMKTEVSEGLYSVGVTTETKMDVLDKLVSEGFDDIGLTFGGKFLSLDTVVGTGFDIIGQTFGLKLDNMKRQVEDWEIDLGDVVRRVLPSPIRMAIYLIEQFI